MSWPRTLSVILFISLAVNLFLAGTMAGRWVGAGGHFGDEGRHWGAKFWLSQALGDEATPKIEAMREVHRAKLEPMRKAARQSRHAIKVALSADPFDPNAYARALEGSLSQRTAPRQPPRLHDRTDQRSTPGATRQTGRTRQRQTLAASPRVKARPTPPPWPAPPRGSPLTLSPG